jgi:hypothetical protein
VDTSGSVLHELTKELASTITVATSHHRCPFLDEVMHFPFLLDIAMPVSGEHQSGHRVLFTVIYCTSRT